ncbi:hypothetical protein MTBSS4_370025 [Magnetospirillum sp. SS-4]|nr:hypothetical protein MTBSS4_370025 [Magnetospirillum sp. SS-4]
MRISAGLRLATIIDFAQRHEHRRNDRLFLRYGPTVAARPCQRDFFRESGQIIVTHGVANETIVAYASRLLTGSSSVPANLRQR